MAKKRKKKKQLNTYSEVYGVIFILVGILLFLPLVIKAESTTKYIAPVLLGVFGLCAYLVPFVFIAIGILKISLKKLIIAPGKAILGTLCVLSAMGLIHLCFASAAEIGVSDHASSFGQAVTQGYYAGQQHIGLGAISAAVTYPITKLVSFWGAVAVFIAIILIAAIVLFNLSLKTCSEKVGKKVKQGIDEAGIIIKEHAQERKQRREEKKNYNYDLEDETEEPEPEKKHDDFDFELEDEEQNDDLVVEKVKPRRRTATTVKTEAEIEAELNDDEPEDELEVKETIKPKKQGYVHPPTSLITPPVNAKGSANVDRSEQINMMESTLKSYGINAWVENITVGPAVTRYELSIERGTRVSKILNLADDIALSMAAVGVRIEAPIPGKSAIGIEIPNESVSMVTLREVLESQEFKKHTSPVAVALGKDITGAPVIADLSAMPHLLIAGQTGAGKSVCINTIITSILFRSSPEEVRMILVDPKKVELNVYDNIPHLLTPVVTDPKKAAGALQFVVREMEKRYETFAKNKVKDIIRYNEVAIEKGEKPMPRYVVIVDELNDLMLVARGEVEDSVMRIAQLARAAGIYLILATQRPSVNVITGVIKANIPTRIAFAVASGIDSKTILDATGAEKLVGKGDMLYHLNGKSKPTRVQGAFIGEQDIEKVVDFIKSTNLKADFIGEEQLIMREIKPSHADNAIGRSDEDDSGEDELFPAAVEYAIECGTISISAIQRRFKVGYSRAGRLIDTMEQKGVVEASQGAKARQVLMTREQFWAMYDERIE